LRSPDTRMPLHVRSRFLGNILTGLAFVVGFVAY
jgi:hypothetical protein